VGYWRTFKRIIAPFLLTLLISLIWPFATDSIWVQAQTAQPINNQASAQFNNGRGETITSTSNQTTVLKVGSAALRIIKASDRQAAEPGDVVVYRLLVENVGNSTAGSVVVTDELPLGLQYVDGSIATAPLTPVSSAGAGRSLRVEFASLAPGESVSIAYAALLTPDAVRGNGRNVAQAGATGLSEVTASNQLVIRPGILADCGTLIGRVFVDKNFDGEQQAGEPGVPNAVIFLDDGNRILTDPEGLFSVANVISGNRVGTLDLSSLPGYSLAPNLYRIEDNSQSRLVRLSPGGLARMNFAVTPAFQEAQP
jgi:uncharacterized repeat protein (TIGR01451 family)